MSESTGLPEPPAPLRMMQALSGFQLSQALYAVARFDVATVLLDGPRTVAELARETGTDPDALGRVVRFLATVGVFTTGAGPDGTGPDVVEVTDFGATLAAGRPDSVRDAALYWMETHYAPFAELAHTVRTGESAAVRHFGVPFFDWLGGRPELVEVQNRAFASITEGLRGGMFDGYRLPAGELVADIGGADGSLLARLLRDEPERRGIVLDRPEVVGGAERVLAARGLSDRVRAVGGDFFTAVPAADVYVLANVLHDWDDAACHRVLRTVAAAAAPGASVVLVEGVMPPGDAPHPVKVLDLTMLALLSGRERTAEEYRAVLDAAGFTLDRIVPTPTPYSFLEATLR